MLIRSSRPVIVSHSAEQIVFITPPSAYPDLTEDICLVDEGTHSTVDTYAFQVLSTFSLLYSADSGGSIGGTAAQAVSPSTDGNLVTAIPDAGFEFDRWSDGSTSNPRIDTNVSQDLRVKAIFRPKRIQYPDPVQQSNLLSISPLTSVTGAAIPVVLEGTFLEKIRAIHVNGIPLPIGSWTQSPSTVSFLLSGESAKTYTIQIYNGSVPVLKALEITLTRPVVVTAPVKKLKNKYIHCTRPGHAMKVIRGFEPTCPLGYELSN